MDLSYQNQLAASCPHFVRSLGIQYSRTEPEMGADFYLINTNYRLIKVGYSMPDENHELKYIAHAGFVKKYCCLFDLGHIFEWNEHELFRDWLNMILNQRPTFIDPYYRSSLTLNFRENLHDGIGIFSDS